MWIPLEADPDASYEEELLLDLSEIRANGGKPHESDNVKASGKQKCKGGSGSHRKLYQFFLPGPD